MTDVWATIRCENRALHGGDCKGTRRAQGWGCPRGSVSSGISVLPPAHVHGPDSGWGVMCTGRCGAQMVHGGDHFLQGLVPVAPICPR